MKRLYSSSVYYNNLFTKTETGDKIKYCTLPNNTDRNRKILQRMLTKKTTEMNWNKGHSCSEHWSKKGFLNNIHCSLFSDFTDENKT